MASVLQYKKQAEEHESLLIEALKTAEQATRSIADVLAALALTAEGGSPSDWLRPRDVAELINCGESKARQIVRAYGVGGGKMGRIQRGVLMQLLKEGKLSGPLD